MAALQCSLSSVHNPQRGLAAAGLPGTRVPFTSGRAPRRRPRSHVAPAALLGRLLELPLFKAQGSSGESSAVAAARRRLWEQLASERPDKQAISQACDELMAAEVPFREADLGPGPWTVRSCTGGGMPWGKRWAGQYWVPLPAVSSTYAAPGCLI